MPNAAARLNDRYSLARELEFHEAAGGLLFAEAHNDLATATVCLQGAQLTAWRPRSQSAAVIWTSAAAQYAMGKSIRGGIPVCWPWFGPHATDSRLPSHGFVRTLAWEVCGSRRLESGETQLSLAMSSGERTLVFWPYQFHLELQLTIGESLRVELITSNTGATDFVLGEALHTYFQVGDIESVRVLGLDADEFIDKAKAGQRSRQAEPIRFHEELDRIYVNSESDCAIEDSILQRRIHIAKFGSRSTVVWSPWVQKAQKLGDLGPGARNQGGWREMVCVESGNALENVVTLAPGATHRLAALYRVEPI
jgi:D-hexose-6-phosphate mutarotase